MRRGLKILDDEACKWAIEAKSRERMTESLDTSGAEWYTMPVTIADDERNAEQVETPAFFCLDMKASC